MQYQEKYQTFIFMILAIPESLIFFTISEHAPVWQAILPVCNNGLFKGMTMMM
jgi:hypothetical protein